VTIKRNDKYSIGNININEKFLSVPE